ncbi:hypothetical protein Tco_1049486 [Tanacetum coccineum]
MTEEEETSTHEALPKKTREQILQEEASLAEAIRLDSIDTIRAKLEANEELTKSMIGSDLQQEDFAKKMVEMVNQRKKYFAEQRTKAKRDTERPNENCFEATKEHLKRFGVELQSKDFKKQKIEHKDDQATDEKVSEAKEEVSTKKSGTSIPINPILVATKPPSIANYKIIKQGKKGVYQIIRENGTDKDDYEKIFWGYLKNMFDAPLSTDAVWSLPGQQRIINWVYYDAYRVHCLNLDSAEIYMLTERSYPLSTKVCKAMLDKKLQGGIENENCYKLLKLMEKQAGIKE